ncbi:MAG: glycoside hydrolase family 57 protein [Candidatus Nezhaarchaeales archaeon]
MAKSVAFMFELHQPVRLRPYNAKCLLDLISRGIDAAYDEQLNKEVFKRVSLKCYKPALQTILENIKTQNFKVSLGISGIWIEQAVKYCSDLVDLLRKAVDTGNVELIAQTYYHSISPLLSDLEEFKEQVDECVEVISEVFGLGPKAAEATEFIYNNVIGKTLHDMGFKTCVTEGVERLLAWRSPNYVYSAYGCDLKLLLRNYRLSDDVAFRFSNSAWDQYPLTADKYADWILNSAGDVVFVAMDFETFGEHHWPETGILEFLKWLPYELNARRIEVMTVSEASSRYRPVGVYDVPPWSTISWADVEKDVSAWIGSDLQIKALKLYEELGMYAKAVGGEYLRHWRLFGVSDNFYYMSSKKGSSGEVHLYFSPFKKPLDAFASYVSLLTSLYEETLREYMKRIEEYAWKVKTPPALSFRFLWNGMILCEARSLGEALESLKRIDREVAELHVARGYLQKWIREVLLWVDLANTIDLAIEKGYGSALEAAIRVLEGSKRLR